MEVASEEEATQLETTMVSDEFANALVADIQKIDSSFASVNVEVTAYVPPQGNKKQIFFFFLFLNFEGTLPWQGKA